MHASCVAPEATPCRGCELASSLPAHPIHARTSSTTNATAATAAGGAANSPVYFSEAVLSAPARRIVILHAGDSPLAERVATQLAEELNAAITSAAPASAAAPLVVEAANMLVYLKQHGEEIEASLLARAAAAIFILGCPNNSGGEPPDSALRLQRRLTRGTKAAGGAAGSLGGLPFAMLGLGDSGDDQFCEAAKRMERQARTVGAVAFHPPAWLDRGENIDATAATWRAAVAASLWRQLGVDASAAAVSSASASTTSAPSTVTAAAAAATTTTAPAANGILVLFASQTGNAREIAHMIGSELSARLAKVEVQALGSYEVRDLPDERRPLVIIASTTGSGDAPDNGERFWRQLRLFSADLTSLRYAMLGLGDTNYENFNQMAKQVDARLSQLGAKSFFPTGLADDGTGLDAVVEPWRNGVIPAVLALVQQEQQQQQQQKQTSDSAAMPASPAAMPSSSASTAAAATASSGSNDADSVEKPPLLPRLRASTLQLLPVDEQTTAPSSDPMAVHARWQRLARSHLSGYTPETPCRAVLRAARWLTSEQSHGRHVLHCEFELPGREESVVYQPGDAIGVYCPNEPAVVEAVLAHLGISPTEADAPWQPYPAALLPHLPAQCSTRRALLFCVDLTSPLRKGLLRALAEHCTTAADRRLLYHWASRGGSDDYLREVEGAHLGLLPLLQRCPSCRPPVALLLEFLPPLMPRYYSAASSPLAHATRVHVAFTIVPHGLCTTWLYRVCRAAGLLAPSARDAELPPLPRNDRIAALGLVPGVTPGAACAGAVVHVFLRRSLAFRPPTELACPLIMVGPGTGVAPFRGFLQHRQAELAALASSAGVALGHWRGLEVAETGADELEEKQGVVAAKVAPPPTATLGEALLFAGCRRRDEDFLYGDELSEFAARGTLALLDTAFSRAQAEKVYVQHRMREHGARLVRLLCDEHAVFYVCGDGARMAKDVMACVEELLVQHRGLTPAAAREAVLTLVREKRYLQDIWS